MELWKQLVDFPDYAISNLGNVKRITAAKGTRIGWIITPHGSRYLYAGLRKEGNRFDRKIHTLVAVTFLGPRPLGKQINHKNCVKHDNRADNLEYVTALENTRHAHQKGRMTRAIHNKRILNKEKVGKIKRLISLGYSQASIGRLYQINATAISKIACGRNWKNVAAI